MRFKCFACGKWLPYKEGFDVAKSDDEKYRNIKITCTNSKCKSFKKLIEMSVRVK